VFGRVLAEVSMVKLAAGPSWLHCPQL